MKDLIPPILTVSPLNLRCAFCDAKPGHDCLTTKHGFAAIHIQRVKEAARINYKTQRIRKAKPQ